MVRVASFQIPIPRPSVAHAIAQRSLLTLTLLLRLFLGGVFVWSSLSKLQQPYDFLSGVYKYELVGPHIGLWVAASIPWLELVTGICLLIGVLERGTWILAIILLAVFTAALYSVASRGLLIPCGCARIPIEIVSYRSVQTTGLLLLIALVGFGCSIASTRFQGKSI